MNTSRIEKAEIKYCNTLQEWLTNPKNESLPDEIVENEISASFDEYIKELLLDETECAEFISAGNRTEELEYLKFVFDHFKSHKIYEAIKINCEIAFSHKFLIESEEAQASRRNLIAYMQKELKISN